jgi:putative ABC transport system permease protein
MNTIGFAARSAFKNRRRSVITVVTVAIGTVALCLFGGFINSVYQGIESGIVRNSGHIHIHQQDYFEYGAGRATDYDIARYTKVIDLIKNDSVLRNSIEVVTPTLALGGIAGNYRENSSHAFVGLGVVPSDQERMRQWNTYGLVGEPESFPLRDSDQGGFIGTGLAKILSLCDELDIPGCRDARIDATTSNNDADASILELQQFEESIDQTEANGAVVAIDLLSASASGAPNIIRLPVLHAQAQVQKALDDRFVAMPLAIAQQLVYGQGERRITSIIIQLKNSADLAHVVLRLKQIIALNTLPLEVKTFEEFNLSYFRVTRMFATIFSFISSVIALVILFTILNNLSMSVMERFNEIGTLRSMGVRRSMIRSQFIWEGAILGACGASLGLLMGTLFVELINSVGIYWTPPSNTNPQALTLNLYSSLLMPFGIWLGLVLVTAMSSLPPANRAARMQITDALRHS